MKRAAGKGEQHYSLQDHHNVYTVLEASVQEWACGGGQSNCKKNTFATCWPALFSHSRVFPENLSPPPLKLIERKFAPSLGGVCGATVEDI